MVTIRKAMIISVSDMPFFIERKARSKTGYVKTGLNWRILSILIFSTAY
jgi:hypothetical protein